MPGAITARRVAVGVVASATWLLIPILVLGGLTLGLAAVVGSSWFLGVAALLTLHSTIGLVGSYATHEVGHALALGRMRGVERVDIRRRPFRFSLVPVGRMTGWQVAGAALAGPLLAVGVGIGLTLVVPASGLQYWFLGHAVFLTPVFGDGRALLAGLALRSRPALMGAE